MRRDVFITNDSGGLSVVAADAVDAIVDDHRRDDQRIVASHKALLQELCGDDSVAIRIVVDEPLAVEEEREWLTRASWTLDAPDHRLVVMGGFDPDVLLQWRSETGGEGDSASVARIDAPGPLVRVDLYAHVGSMNGRQLLWDAGTPPGEAFRRAHHGRRVPMWLAKMLEFSGEGDPARGDLWNDVPGAVEAGQLEIDTSGPAAIGFLVHVTRAVKHLSKAPASGWFPPTVNQRVPRPFPVGLPTHVRDESLEIFRNRVLRRQTADADQPPAPTAGVALLTEWAGEPLTPLTGDGPAVALAPSDAFLLYLTGSLAGDTSPRFELRVTDPSRSWTAQGSGAVVVTMAGDGVTTIGVGADESGWDLWWDARDAAALLADVPNGSTLELAMVPRRDDEDEDEDVDPTVGRAWYCGTVVDGQWEIAGASPAVSRSALVDAIAFTRDLVAHKRLPVRGEVERQAFDEEAMMYGASEEKLRWVDEGVTLAQHDDRMLWMLAAPVFRTRFAGAWAGGRER